MDPLSIASGVAGLLTVSAAVIKTFDVVKTSIKDCPRTVFWAHAETKEINWAIKRLKSLIDDPDSVPKAAKMSVGLHDATVTISELIKTCDQLITTLKPLDKDGKVVLTRWDRVKWLRVQDDVVKYIRQIQAHKGSVTLILNILQCESDVVIVESQRALELKIDAVLNSSEATQRRIEGLEALFNKFIADNSTLIPSNRSSMAPTLYHLKEDDATETDSVATSRKYDQDEWGGFHASAERSLSFPTSSVPELGMPKLKRSTSAETSTKSESNGTTSTPPREFEAALQETGVYKRVYNSTDAFSIHSAQGRSITGSVMTSFSLADDSSILSAFPIMSRTELQHPEFYTQMSGNQRISRDLMRAITTRSVVKSPVEPPPGAPFSLKQFRSPPYCGENVMGRWHQSRTKVWRPKEFRTEILFEVPIIFVTTSKAAKGPIDGADVFFIDGTRKSLDDTWTDLEPPTAGTFTKTGRFIKNERATWLALLSSLQKMENESQNWTRQQIMGLRPRPASATAILTSIAGKHTLNVALQREKKSWDDMPPSINRPYATTTMSSLIEMLAMLGIYWKDFNTFHNVYQAEGNGFLVKGHKISGLGIMFHFQALEKAVFEGNRTIPTEAVTRLAFGQLPTIFNHGHPEYKSSNLMYEWPNVVLGSRAEIAETLASFGCGRKAVNYFLRDGAVTSHIFPITFELIGMIGQVFHIKDLCFRYIPNPCYCIWSTKGFSLPKLLAAYRRYLQDDPDMANGKLSLQLNTVFATKTGIRSGDDTPQSYTWQAQDALHSVLDELDESLQAYSSPENGSPRVALGQEIVGAHFEELLSQMNSTASTSAFLPANAGNKEDTLMKASFQQILPAVLRSASMTFFNLKNADSEFQVVKGEAAQTAEYAEYLRAAKEAKPFSRKMSESRNPRPKRALAFMRPTDSEYYQMSNHDKSLWTAFEIAKPRMCGQAAQKTAEAIEKHRRYGGYAYPSIHPFYVKIKGKGQIGDPDCYYYPYLLVLQALWPGSEHVQTMAKAFARYWGVPNLWRGPEHYPRLNDRDREMKLFMGKKERETEAQEDESSSEDDEDKEDYVKQEDESSPEYDGGNGEEEEYVKHEDTEEQEQQQEDEQEEEQEQDQQRHGERNQDDDEQEEQQDEGNEDTVPDIDATTDIEELDKIENMLENREKEFMKKVHETKELIRKVQEAKRDHFKKESRASKKAEERLLKKVEARRKTSEYWGKMEREYTKKLEQSAATPSAISPPPEQEAERPAKRQRVVESEE
ncbi:modin [Fusarium pseudoanthophilum]|uniref:Modin n=1 Tax=Fusarium pseudoanthophilum TaxID=48495 RepID=A0A8H5KIA9_9HYPO|nr:modin [Fusarium pseudoanthophilum]